MRSYSKIINNSLSSKLGSSNFSSTYQAYLSEVKWEYFRQKQKIQTGQEQILLLLEMIQRFSLQADHTGMVRPPTLCALPIQT